MKEFNATFETGEMIEYSSLKKKNTETGKKYVEQAKLGKDNIIIPYEYRKIDSATIGQSLNMIYKWMGYSTDSKANWDIHIYGDVYKNNQSEQQLYFEPYLLENPVVGKVLTLNENNKWEGSFTGLAKYNKDGSEIKYDVAELKIDGYESKKIGDAKIGFTFTNKNTEKVSIPVEKKWVGKKADKVVIKLLVGNEVKDTVTLNQGNEWKHVFKNLPKYNKDGSKIPYDIEEVKVDGYITGKSGTAETGFTITNTITGKVSVPVTKKWEGKEGDSATINLLADGKKVDSIVLNKDNNWQHTFANLEKYKDGNEIKYTIEEVKLPFYDMSQSGNAQDGFVVTNKHVPPVKRVYKGGTTTKIDGKKVNPGDKLTYVVTYKNTTGKEVEATITDKIPAHTKFVSADNGGKYADGKVTWTKKVANGETFKVTFTVEVDKDVNGEVIKNKAKVNDGENDYDTNETTNPTPKKPKTPESKNPNRPNGPRTGDDTNLTLLMLLLLSSCGALGTAVTIRRKRR